MSFDNFLNETCTITRPVAEVATDRYNASVFADVVMGEARCRLVEKSVKLLDAKTSEYSWIKAKVLLVPRGTDVKALDKVTVSETVYEVKSMLSRKNGTAEHHVSCMVGALNV